MTYKDFAQWCNERACDGCWGLETALRCINIINLMQSTPFWKRKKKWQEYEQQIVTLFVNPTNEKIHEYFAQEG